MNKYHIVFYPRLGDFYSTGVNVEAENEVISELKEIGKPFIVLLNSAHPTLPET